MACRDVGIFGLGKFLDARQPDAAMLRWLAAPSPKNHLDSPSLALPAWMMKALFRLFGLIHGLIAAMFAGIALLIIGIAAQTIWHALSGGFNEGATNGIIEAIGLIAVAVVALQIAQTIMEEEVIRDVHVSAPTRVRRYLSRFMVVIVIALAVEGLVTTFKAVHSDMEQLPHAASILLAVAVLVAGWGAFIHLNRSAEELEPEAMKEAKSEDRKLD